MKNLEFSNIIFIPIRLVAVDRAEKLEETCHAFQKRYSTFFANCILYWLDSDECQEILQSYNLDKSDFPHFVAILFLKTAEGYEFAISKKDGKSALQESGLKRLKEPEEYEGDLQARPLLIARNAFRNQLLPALGIAQED